MSAELTESLSRPFSQPLPKPLPKLLPEPLALNYSRYRQQFLDTIPEALKTRFSTLQDDATFARQLQWVWSGSEFAAGVCRKMPDVFLACAENNYFSQSKTAADFEQELRTRLQTLDGAWIAGEDELASILRKYRNAEMLRIIWRDLTRQANLLETTGDLSALADACIRCCLEVLHPMACEQWGAPIGADSGAEQSLVVIAMGKLGAGELNLSSDIDLIFAYPEEGETQGGQASKKTSLSNQEFFIRLGQKLIKALDQATVDGFVFRVDMRLRPYGQSGALVYNFDALEEYYQTQGREWERYAMIKARIVTGKQSASEGLSARLLEPRLSEMLRSFTYRKYIDFTAIESLRDMKALINREVARRGKAEDVKLGAGGIREVEFIAQAFQLIRGGRDSRFQNPRLRDILQLLDAEQLLSEDGGAHLWEAYRFLRDTEHVVQAWRDQQTQALPGDEEGRSRVAAMMGFESWDQFSAALAAHRQVVRSIFDEVASSAPDGEAGAVPVNEQASSVWQLAEVLSTEAAADSELNAVAARTELRALAYREDEATFKLLRDLRSSRAVLAMQQDTRSRLDTLMPLLIADCASLEAEGLDVEGLDSKGPDSENTASSDETLRRVVAIVEAVVRRSVYLVLLIENPAARQQVVQLCAASAWVASELTRYPALLDELLDPRTLYTPPVREVIADELRQQILRIPADDLEAQMDALRYFRRAHALRVAACEIIGALPLMKVSDYLTWLAEVILDYVLVMTWGQMEQRYGKPGSSSGEAPNFLIVGYGKLGGLELGHGSDLDLVFIHDGDSALTTDGERPVDNETFFARLGQRIIHILSAQTASGTLYDIDMRLRPSGNSGLLVTSLVAFEKYQRESAWTWEHQALVRARAVAGSSALATGFEALRASVLSQPRDTATLKSDVIAMREKMRSHLDSGGSVGEDSSSVAEFDLKQGVGGIVDIEFMVQFEVLALSHSHPELTRWTDNIRILGDCAKLGLMSSHDVDNLCEAYKAYRAAGHRRQLQLPQGQLPKGSLSKGSLSKGQLPQGKGKSGRVAVQAFSPERAAVTTIWQRLLGDDA
ncbi:MAG: bifunctional [glutamate--ammonia ligase]-adenylyl-L-tyrosine phosphorylase/[glutamate--ammonia-ligase] adenylyltransferase [Porticoccaceae bacterium]|nr:bifunctional [glutamate--ammonia ligase]-adenylyl-L-tyrosine phosphorylase/[glutamate--ammonia-ligase] adenylyltransferase [Porticoccaceae bacterium]